MTYEDFIAPFKVQHKTARGVMVVCPAHGDSPKGPSLSVGRAQDGGVLLKCFAGCTSRDVVAALGLSLKDLFAKERAVHFEPPAQKATNGHEPTAVKPVIEKIYPYHDAAGREVYQAIRLIPKSFRQRHRNPEYDSEHPSCQEWIWSMDGIVRVLYRLPQIIKAETVWIVEGEKDANNLVELGFEATCNVGGAGKWLDAYSESLAGKRVIICGDNDKPGQDHAKLVFDSIAATAKSVAVVKMPGSIKDVSDFIATFKTKEEARLDLQQMASDAPPHINGKILPLYTIAECENDYRRFVRSMGANAFSLGRWLPTLGTKLRFRVPGELIFIIGDTGSAKTGVLQQLAKASRPLPGVFFELELPKEIMFERFASMTTKFTGEQVERAYQDTDDTLGNLLEVKLPNLVICPTARLTVAQMEDIITRSELKLGERPKIVFIDYVQLVGAEGPNRREKISDIAEQLKIMAKATRTIVIVASQVSRPEKSDKKWRPTLHSAKESGSIESSSGLLIGVWKDGGEESLLHVQVLKSTNGGAGTYVACNFDGSRMIITERSKIADADVPRTNDP